MINKGARWGQEHGREIAKGLSKSRKGVVRWEESKPAEVTSYPMIRGEQALHDAQENWASPPLFQIYEIKMVQNLSHRLLREK